MKPVYQTIFGSYAHTPRGNCMQAAWASLLELKLDDVPDFISRETEKTHFDWFECWSEFLKQHEYEYIDDIVNPRMLRCMGEDRINSIKDEPGINGYFQASVLSPKYFEFEKLINPDYSKPTHAVIVDRELNIVHDPHPEYQNIKKYPLADVIGYNGILSIWLVNPIKTVL